MVARVELAPPLQHQVAPTVQGRQVVAGHAQQVVLGGHEVASAGAHRPLPGDRLRLAEHGHLVEERDAIAGGLVDRVGKLLGRQVRDGQAGDHAPRQLAQDFFLEVGDQRGRVGLAHLHEADDDRLAGLEQEAEELGRNLVVVALVGGDVDDHVGQPGDFQEPGHVGGSGPGRHVGAIPDHEARQQAEVARLDRHAAALVDVGVEAGRTGLAQPPKVAQEAEVCRPAHLSIGAGVGDGVAREAGLRVGLGQGGPAEEVGDRALACARAAHHRDVQGRRRLAAQERADAVAHQGGREAQLSRLARLLGVPAAVLLQPGQVVRELARQVSVAEGIHHEAR